MGVNMAAVCALLFVVSGAASLSIFEGDIVMTDDLQRTIDGKATPFDAQTDKRWPKGIVPYMLHKSIDDHLKGVIDAAINEFKKHTCVRFIPRKKERSYVEFYQGRGCSSMVGRRGNIGQDISIAHACDKKGNAIHEMMHALGFHHEQSRYDRDDNVIIHWKNISRGRESNFKMYSHGEIDLLGEPYDLDSIMHYPNNAFGRGKITIESKKFPGKKFGQRDGFSPIDIRQINKLYNCVGTKPNPKTPPPTKPPPGCKDLESDCPQKARNGLCNQWWSKQTMKTKCKLSCSFC